MLRHFGVVWVCNYQKISLNFVIFNNSILISCLQLACTRCVTNLNALPFYQMHKNISKLCCDNLDFVNRPQLEELVYLQEFTFKTLLLIQNLKILSY